MFNDPIAELLTKIRNAVQAQHRYVDVYVSSMKLWILEILKKQGYIENYIVNEQKRQVRIFLKYNNRRSILQGIKRISSPGVKKYVGYRQIPKIVGGIGTVIISTSKGVMDGETARGMRLGGEILCYVW